MIPAGTRVLIAGVGNIFLGDDGFGPEVARYLQGRHLPEGAAVADFGIAGVHLAYELLNGYDTLVLLDAMPLGEAPGTLCVVEPDPPADAPPALDAHGMSPAAVLGQLSELGGAVGRVLVVGCEPAELAEGIGLSAPVAAAVPRAADLAVELAAAAVAEAPSPPQVATRSASVHAGKEESP